MFILVYLPVATAIILLSGVSTVQASGGQLSSPDQVIEKIKGGQGIADIADFDCGQVTEAQFEELGDAVMELIHPGEQHELMDQMMGGEGSDSLRAAHIMMGQRYLSCSDDNMPSMMNYGIMGMMGGGRAMTGGVGGEGSFTWTKNCPMMGNLFYHTGSGWFWGWFYMILITIVLILLMAALVKWLMKDGRDKK